MVDTIIAFSTLNYFTFYTHFQKKKMKKNQYFQHGATDHNFFIFPSHLFCILIINVNQSVNLNVYGIKTSHHGQYFIFLFIFSLLQQSKRCCHLNVRLDNIYKSKMLSLVERNKKINNKKKIMILMKVVGILANHQIIFDALGATFIHF